MILDELMSSLSPRHLSLQRGYYALSQVCLVLSAEERSILSLSLVRTGPSAPLSSVPAV